MDDKDRRRAVRHDSLNFIQFVVLGEENGPALEGMGRTLKISERGLLLETFSPLEKGEDVVLTLALGENVVEIRGRVVNASLQGAGSCHSGIEFVEVTPTAAVVLLKYLEAFQAAHSD